MRILNMMERIPNRILRNIIKTLFFMLINPLSIAFYMMFICAAAYKYLL